MLKESDINFRALVYEIYEGIYICNPDSKLIYANLALANIFGFERPQDIIGRNFIDFFSPERKKEFSSHFLKSMKDKDNSAPITAEVIRQDCTTAIIEIKPLAFIKDGKLLGGQGMVYDLTKKKRTENELIFLSTHDPLSGLYNRNFFEAELKRLERGRQVPISIIVINVDILEPENDLSDQEIKDKLLKHMAHILFRSFRGDDIVARVSEDKFAILLPYVDKNSVDTAIKRVRANLSEYIAEIKETVVDFYIGTSTSENGTELNSVLRRAGSIMDLEKKKNKIE